MSPSTTSSNATAADNGIVVAGSSSSSSPPPLRRRVQVWGHRGASADYPENTLASFRAAIASGCDGIETDAHVTRDGVVLMFHDPTLDRTTLNGTGKIREQRWHDDDEANGTRGIKHVRTRPKVGGAAGEPIPQFEELVQLLMAPEARHVVLNIDCKIQNDPDVLFPLMAEIIARYEDPATPHAQLSSRIILGLWHPLFLLPARRHLPHLRRIHIGASIAIARKFFLDPSRPDDVEGVSMAFPMLMGRDGPGFMHELRQRGKYFAVWTVNDDEEMRRAASWGAEAILTDKPVLCREVREQWERNPSLLSTSGQSIYSRLVFPWSSWKYYSVTHIMFLRWVEDNLRKNAYRPGPLEDAPVDPMLAEGGGVAGAEQQQQQQQQQQSVRIGVVA